MNDSYCIPDSRLLQEKHIFFNLFILKSSKLLQLQSGKLYSFALKKYKIVQKSIAQKKLKQKKLKGNFNFVH